MKSSFRDPHFWIRFFWALSLTAIVIWALIPSYSIGWDVDVYHNAILSLRAGHNPYADAIAVERAYQSNPLAYHPGIAIPYCYVYSPITLPFLRAIAALPLHLTATLYWSVYVLFAAVMVWVSTHLFKQEEKLVFGLIAPIAIFFPGMLSNDVLFSGNVAIILYGLAWAAALLGWKRNRWLAFYVIVFIAGCFKAPMLSLLIIPVLSARKQWMPAAITAVAGIAMFLIQPLLWPNLFRTYLQAVDLQFRFNRDFSSSPAGLIANALFFREPYRLTSLVAYLAYAIVVVAVLYYFSRRYLDGRITLEQWVPFLMVGAILLNPRIMEYDLLPITLPMVLLTWRFFARGRSLPITIVLMSLFFAIINTLAMQAHTGLENPPWKLTAGFTIVAVFAAGAWNLHKESRARNSA